MQKTNKVDVVESVLHVPPETSKVIKNMHNKEIYL